MAFYAAACQTDFPNPKTRTKIASHPQRMCAIIEQTIIGYEPFFDVRLFAFPEFAHAAPIYETVAQLRRHLAVPVPNEHTRAYERLARKHGCYIQTGSFLETDPDWPDAVFNTTVLVGPKGVLLKYRKVNPWIPWEVHASPHDLPGYDRDPFPVADTELGRIMVIDYDGRILAQADPGPGEKVVVAPIDVAALRAERARRTGHDMRAHLRSEVHDYLRRTWLAPGGHKPIEKSRIERRIRDAKRKLPK